MKVNEMVVGLLVICVLSVVAVMVQAEPVIN